MTKDDLLKRIQGYEWTDFECKKAQRDVPKDAYSTVSAFTNTQGGWLLFGVSEANGLLEISGVEPTAFDQMQDAFLTTLRSGQKLNHVINAQPHVYELDGKRLLAFYIPESDRHQKPVYLNGNPRDSYIRRGARDERMTTNELQRFLRDAMQQAWDGVAVTDFPVESSIDRETLSWYQTQFARRNPEQREITDPVEFLLEWNFMVHQAGKPVLTRAAILLFGVDRCVRALLPRPVLDYQRIDARFESWSADERWHDRLVFEENLFKTWRGLVAKYSRVAEHPFKIDPATMRRNDDPPDYIAFREAAINLLIHQDYGDQHRKASLKWFIDRFVFWNPGDAFATTAQLLESNEKEIRNPLIVNAFRRIGLSDQAGTGIRAIYRNWQELGHHKPIIQNDKAGKSFELILDKAPVVTEAMLRFHHELGVRLTAEQADVLLIVVERHSISLTEATECLGGHQYKAHEVLDYLCHQQLLQQHQPNSYTLAEPIRRRLLIMGQSSRVEEAHDQAHDQAHELTNLEITLLKACWVTPQSSNALLAVLGYQTRTGNFKKAMAHLVDELALLARTLPNAPRSKHQQYQLTDLGRRWLAPIMDKPL